MQHLNDLPVKELAPGFTSRLIHGVQITVSFVSIKKGCTLPLHNHPHEQVTHIVEGELAITIGNEQFVLTPGTVHVIPSNVLHGAFANTDCTVIDFFSPARDDYR